MNKFFKVISVLALLLSVVAIFRTCDHAPKIKSEPYIDDLFQKK